MSGGTRSRGVTVLVADDDVVLIETVKALLEGQGYHVLTAHNGAQVMDMIEQTAPQLIVLDIDMPEMDGESTALKLRSRPEWRTIPILMLTGIGDVQDQHFLSTLGVQGYLCKPCPPDEFLHAIRRTLDAKGKKA